MEMLVVEEVNHHAVQMFGAKDRSALLGAVSWVWKESPGTFRRALESRYRGEPLFQETTRLPTLDGRISDVLFTVARSRTADDLGIALISLVDLTERIRAQDMLQRLQADFAHAARISVLGELSASIAHELNQPLAAIALNCQVGLRWLDRAVPDVAEARETNQRIAVDARRALDIVGRIRGMAVRREPQHTIAPLDELIDEALVFLRQEVQSRGVIVFASARAGRVDGARRPRPVAAGDREPRCQRDTGNGSGGKPGAHHHRSHDRPDAATLYCSIEDSGPGIAPERLDRLFQSFFTTKENGMGMGLPICRTIIDAHGGRIAVDNASVHGGARFYFTLPAVDGRCHIKVLGFAVVR